MHECRQVNEPPTDTLTDRPTDGCSDISFMFFYKPVRSVVQLSQLKTPRLALISAVLTKGIGLLSVIISVTSVFFFFLCGMHH